MLANQSIKSIHAHNLSRICTWGFSLAFEDVPNKCPKQFLSFIKFVCRREHENMFLGKHTARQVLKPFSDRKKSLKPPIFGFSNNFPFSLEEWQGLIMSWLDRSGEDIQKC